VPISTTSKMPSFRRAAGVIHGRSWRLPFLVIIHSVPAWQLPTRPPPTMLRMTTFSGYLPKSSPPLLLSLMMPAQPSTVVTAALTEADYAYVRDLERQFAAHQHAADEQFRLSPRRARK